MSKETRFEKLFRPLKIGSVTFKNRIVSPAHANNWAQNGFISESDRSYYEATAMGGVAMIVVGNSYVDSRAGKGLNRIFVDDEKYIPGLAQLTTDIHKHNCLAFLQIGHPGPSGSQRNTGFETISASRLTDADKPIASWDIARELTMGEIEDLVRKFAKASEIAKKAGFDGVEVHCAHAYLINSFLSRAWNKRKDAYGIQDLRSRAKFAVDIIKAIKQTAGSEFNIGVRVNGAELGLVNGETPEESKQFSKLFQDAGADYIHVTGYGYGRNEWQFFPELIGFPEPTDENRLLANQIRKPGAFIGWAENIKSAVSIPVIGVGRLNPMIAEWLLEKGKIDLVAFGRRLMADPDMPNKIASGRLEDIRPCMSCGECLNRLYQGLTVTCRVNASLGKETEYAIELAKMKRRVAIVGGGPAGMEAARVAALRGHKVILYDRSHILGGLVNLAALIKGTEIEDLPALVGYYQKQLNKLGVQIELGNEVDARLIANTKPDVVILATGAKLNVPKIPGIQRSNVVTTLDLHRKVKPFLRCPGLTVLRSITKLWMPIGKKVVIVGGLIQGCETAEFLIKRGRKVTVIESSQKLGLGIPYLIRRLLLRWFERKRVVTFTGVDYEEITPEGIVISKGGKKHTLAADTILVIALPMPNTDLKQSLKNSPTEIYEIGDCANPRLMLNAIADALRIARTI
ncbi:FAD-dependent oxidoreductase [Chloroflexota bacterium]